VQLPSGGTITIDRDHTEFSVNGNRLTMTWYGCYLWAIDDHNIFGDYGCHDINVEELKNAVMSGASIFFELEDDVDDSDYYVTLEEIYMY
jgi:hypothetical protein